jgi:hypothetical protein
MSHPSLSTVSDIPATAGQEIIPVEITPILYRIFDRKNIGKLFYV